jgi:hypothetical protein
MSKITKQRKLSETTAMLATRRPQPYELWRTLAASEFDEVRKLEIVCHVGMFMSTIKEYRGAIAGDAACAAKIALCMVVPDEIDYPTDARMTLLLHSVLRGSAGAALVMAHMLRKMPLDHKLKHRLARSWMGRGQHRSGRDAPQDRQRLFVRRSIASQLLGKSDSQS